MFVSAKELVNETGYSCQFFREQAIAGNFPDGAVISSPGGHFRYDKEVIINSLRDKFKKLTKTSRMEARQK